MWGTKKWYDKIHIVGVGIEFWVYEKPLLFPTFIHSVTRFPPHKIIRGDHFTFEQQLIARGIHRRK